MASSTIDDRKQRAIVLCVTMAAIAIDGAAEPATGGVLSPMVAAFGGGGALATLVSLGFTVAYDLSILCSLWLIDNHGKRGYFRGSLFGYATACVLCAAAPSASILAAARIAQGACLGGLFACALLTMVAISPPKRLPYVFAVFTLVALAAPESGPLLSALVAHAWGWRGVFVALAILPLVAASIVSLLMKDVAMPVARQFDTASFIAAGIVLMTFSPALERPESWNGAIAVVSLLWFLTRELWLARAPFVDLRPFRIATIQRGLAGCVLLGIILGSSASLSIYAIVALRLTPVAASALGSAGIIGAIVGAGLLLRIWLGARIENKVVTIAGLVLLAGVYALEAFGANTHAGAWMFVTASMIGGFALAWTIGALASLLFDAVPHEQFGALALLFKIALVLGSACAVPIVAAIHGYALLWSALAALAASIALIILSLPHPRPATSPSST